MKTLLRKDSLRLPAITLYRAELILLTLGLVKSAYDLLGNENGGSLENLIFSGPGITLINMVAMFFLIAGLKRSRFSLLGIGYLLYTAATIFDFYIVNMYICSQVFYEASIFIPFIACSAVFIIFYLFIVFLLIRQAGSAGRISDKDRKKWIIPGILYILGFFSLYICFFVICFNTTELRSLIAAFTIITLIGLIFAKLLDMVALFCCMRWLTCPAVICSEDTVEGGKGDE